MLLQLACLALVASFARGVVHFTSSSLYDCYDFQQAREVPLPLCDNGCLIYASATNPDYGFMTNIVIQDHANDGKYMDLYDYTSISTIAKQVQNGQKLPYELPKGNYSILNFNGVMIDFSLDDLAIYVIESATAKAIDFEMYDAGSMVRGTVAPKNVITVMGAKAFVVKAHKGAANSLTARLAGPDNAAENNVDQCTYAYKTQQFNGLPFDGFEFHVNGPLVSLVFDQKNPVAIKADYNWLKTRDLSKGGFIAPPGYNGCARVDPAKVFRQWKGDFSGEEFDFHSKTKVTVTWDVDSNVTQDIVMWDNTNNKRSTVSGVKKNVQIVMLNTDFVTSYYHDAAPPHGFIARHVPTRA